MYGDCRSDVIKAAILVITVIVSMIAIALAAMAYRQLETTKQDLENLKMLIDNSFSGTPRK